MSQKVQLERQNVPRNQVKTNDLDCYLTRLGHDNYDRHFDFDIRDEITTYVRPEYRAYVLDAMDYLKDLVSKSDGRKFCQGYYQAEKLRTSIEEFGGENHPWFGWNDNYVNAKNLMLEWARSLRLKNLSYASDDDVRKAIPKENTNAGYTGYLTGKHQKRDNMEGIFKRVNRAIADIHEGQRLNIPIVPACRTQGKGKAFKDDGSKTHDCDHKTRAVMMVDILVIALECIYAVPFQHAIAEVPWYAGGKNLDTDLHVIIHDCASRYPYWTSLDYSGYDHSISDWLIRDAFDIIRAAFIPDGVDESVFTAIREQFISKEILLPKQSVREETKVLKSHKGVPSGSMFTSIVDSLVNRLMILTYAYAKGLKVEMCIMGDDNLVFSDNLIDKVDIATYLTKNFGIEVNPDKTKLGTRNDDPEFLSCTWHILGRERLLGELIGKMLYPERDRPYYRRSHGQDDVLVTPQHVFYAYLLCYPKTMYEVFDIHRFLLKNPRISRMSLKDFEGSRHLPGVFSFIFGGFGLASDSRNNAVA